MAGLHAAGLRTLLVGVLVASGIVVFAPVARAALPAASADEICDQISLEEPDLSQLGTPSKFNKGDWKAAAKAFKDGAKGAPSNVAAAMTTMSSYYAKIAKAGSANAALQSITAKDTTKSTKASLVWGTYVAENCSSTG
jgi:hypothetical protein